MTSIKASVTGANIVLDVKGVLTSGAVGVPVEIEYDRSWENLTKSVFFRCGKMVRKQSPVSTSTVVPWEILRTPGRVLEIGIEGRSVDGAVVIPTVWGNASVVYEGAYGEIPAAPNPNNGEIPEYGGSSIDDSAISKYATWSSWNIVDKLCPEFQESGSVVVCEPVEGYPLEVVSKIIPKQSGSGDPSPENVRPIESWTGAKLWRGGKNLLPDGWDDWSNYTAHYTDDNPKVFPFELPPGNYCISVECDNAGGTKENYVYLVKSTDGGQRYTEENALGAGKAGYILEGKSTEGSIAFEVTDDPNEKWGVWTRSYDVPYIKYLQIEVGSVATEYEPYCGEEITIDFGQSVYGGSYNWKTGELTVDRVKVVLSGNFGADGNQFYTPIAEPALASDASYNCICSHYPSRTRNQVYSYANTEGYLGCSASRGYIRVVDNARFNGDASAFNAWLAENNIDVVYQLDNPKTIQLTPQEILALSGVNTLYTDTGNTTVSGRADTSAVIEKLTNAIIALGGNV